MAWDDKYQEWLSLDVTKAFFSEIDDDLQKLNYSLIYEEDKLQIVRLQGMVRAYRAVADMALSDRVEDPEKKETCNE